MSEPDYDEAWARGLTTRELATGLRNIRPIQSETNQARAIMNEAARRIESGNEQMLITLPGGAQVFVQGTRVMRRASVAGSWSLPLPQSPGPHVEGTFYLGEY